MACRLPLFEDPAELMRRAGLEAAAAAVTGLTRAKRPGHVEGGALAAEPARQQRIFGMERKGEGAWQRS